MTDVETADSAAEILLPGGNSVELLGTYGSDKTHALSAWTSTARELTKEKEERIPELLKYLASNQHETPFEKSMLHFLIKCYTASHIHVLKHRIGVSTNGECLAPDTEVWTETITENSGRTIRKREIKDLYNRWHYGVQDKAHKRRGRKNKGTIIEEENISRRTRLLPSCRNQTIRVLNEETGFFELAVIEDIVKNGKKELYKLETIKGFSIKASKDHLIYTSNGWKRLGDLTLNDEIAVNGKRNKNKRIVSKPLRQAIGVWTTQQRTRLILPYDYCYMCCEEFDRNHLDLDHVIPVALDLKKALDEDNLKPICKNCHKQKIKAEQELKNAQIIAGVNFSRLKTLPYKIGEETTYDLVLRGEWKGFVANGIVVHNSARYKELQDDKFFIPPDWPPEYAKYFEEKIKDLYKEYHFALKYLEKNIGRTRAKESARFWLPYANQLYLDVSFNFRSFMHFQLLRNDRDHAQKEVNDIAEAMLTLVRNTNLFNESLKGFGYATS